ncbi:bifunctional transcriptional activator/DNA repair enzyme AdaA [Colwellia psychrerythraea]|uniref:methylated-DNA--[protein]-cysteine S-methyltransferase n=1 Tax=Colwellia psychrerythraea TaxID=28229 RepID=A0A099KVR4_COLPS|nr:methylated-DNA--[protein]-cysteine S-methyltransferase [Colwellia psychrerythraea]KGJ94839.1 Ada DNA repair protein and transcriptional regulator, AraC family [Colwellia psychrerythraea]
MTDDVYWHAITEHDAAFDFQFYYGVKSTKTFCFPSCKSKAPLRKNVTYFSGVALAQADGYQACQRCQPNKKTQQDTGLVKLIYACNKIEQHSEGSLTALQLAKSMGLTQFQINRLFKKYLNVTPKNYIDQIQLNTLKINLRNTDNVSHAIYQSGIESSSVIYGRMITHLAMTPKNYLKGGAGIKISYAMGETRLGQVLMAATDKGLSFLQFGESKHQLLAQLVTEYPNAEIMLMPEQSAPQLEHWLHLLNLYLAGCSNELNLPLDIRATAFQKRVWDFLKTIPYGEVMSYGEIAKAIGSPKAFRAVANACAGNNIALVIPCHRVIRGDGSLGGYRWGEKRKRMIIDIENKLNI